MEGADRHRRAERGARGPRVRVATWPTAPRVPAMVAPDAFEVGRDLAVTPGAVVLRTEIFELIQYEPATPRVHEFPLVIVPPMINKFYVTDLAPGRSMVEYLVAQGHQVFAISWRNPDARHRDWGTDAYGQAIVDALNAARSICGAAKASIFALCSGGIVSSMVAAHLADTGGLEQLAVAVSRGDRARPGAGGHRGGAGRRARGGAGRRGLTVPRLPGRPVAGRGVRLAAAQRPDLELLGQQLPAGQDPAAVRHPVLERRHHPDAGRAAPRLHRHRPDQRAGQARRGDDARLAGGPVPGGRGLLRGGRHRRPPVPVAVLLPQHPAARRRRPVRAVHQRAHRVDGQPAGQPEGEVPGRAGRGGSGQPARPARLAAGGRDRARAAGGRTTPPGSPSAAAARRTGRASWATRDSSRWNPRPACTSSTGSRPAPARASLAAGQRSSA